MNLTPCFTLLIFLFYHSLIGQNCNAYLYYGDTCQYEACKIAAERQGHYQFSEAYHAALDRAIQRCSQFAPAYRHKSVAYLKSGDMAKWKQYIDLAVQYDPADNLGYRGWCRYQFFRDYIGAIQDIEQLDSLVDYNIGYSANGDYHLQIARALCYKGLGDRDTAIVIIENQLADSSYQVGLYDYLHLGVLYLETEQHIKAIEKFRRQSHTNDNAENQYYWGQTQLILGNKKQALSYFLTAKRLYLAEQRMIDPYSRPMDQISMEDIETSIKLVKME